MYGVIGYNDIATADIPDFLVNGLVPSPLTETENTNDGRNRPSRNGYPVFAVASDTTGHWAGAFCVTGTGAAITGELQ